MKSLLAVAAVAALSLPLVPAHAAPAPQTRTTSAATALRAPAYKQYVALGDSWSADVVFANSDGTPDDTYAPIDCAQSHHNYPKIIAATLGVPIKDATCGSATTDDFTAPQDLPAGGQNPPQFNRLTKQTDLVTVGIGGNDAGIAGAGMDCLNALPVANPLPDGTVPSLPDNPVPIIGSEPPLGGCKAKYTAGGHDRLSERIQESEPKLVAAFRAIHRISPKARILAIDYLSLVPDHGCYPTVPATDEDMAYIHAKFIELNAMVKQAAAEGGAEFVNTFTPTLGHDFCQLPTVRYGEIYGPSVNDPAVGVPAHPNAAGARAQAAVILKYLRNH
ncbi:SGNH/GDSL hydrolase family protein [Nocardioides sp. LS1]|uniref:SGNH/GDSL hydrolase family protein n=1 Tax=Nocardioides sp. LS1 TaxID=1027620 RepID=UPI000F61A9A5|nr:SGNH/GDSL hydrolase family protein [Nocardioides sp. LS1]GCD91072.1 hydrolase [Nocardioides sp. LS1]